MVVCDPDVFDQTKIAHISGRGVVLKAKNDISSIVPFTSFLFPRHVFKDESCSALHVGYYSPYLKIFYFACQRETYFPPVFNIFSNSGVDSDLKSISPIIFKNECSSLASDSLQFCGKIFLGVVGGEEMSRM